MALSYTEDNAELRIRKAIGREHLYANRIEDALAVFAGILRDHPEDVEALVILGDLYLASGDSSTAMQLYGRAMQLSKENTQIGQRLALAKVETVNESKEASQPGKTTDEPVHPKAMARLLQRLTGRSSSITENSIQRAVEFLDTVLKSPNPAQKVAESLGQVSDLTLALIELNIRQARAEGRYDIAQMLQQLQVELVIQSSTPSEQPSEKPSSTNKRKKKSRGFKGYVLILCASPDSPSERVLLLNEAITSLGGEAAIRSDYAKISDHTPSVVIACNPHGHPALMTAIAASSSAHIPIIVDIEADFEQMPPEHPDYKIYSLTSPTLKRAYTSALLLANLITVPSAVLAQRLSEAGYNTFIVPDGWSQKKLSWTQTSTQASTATLGWIGYSGQSEELAQIRRTIIRILREFPELQLVIVGDQQAYQLFESVPLNRKRFLPLSSPDELPFLLEQIKILLVPFQDTPFNHSQSDRPLLHAGIKGVPWIASPVPAFVNWEEGGLIVSTPDQWHTLIKQIVQDEILRNRLIQAGQHHAQKREASLLKQTWLEVLDTVLPALTDHLTDTPE